MNIKVIIWDVDGTLYKPSREFHDAVRRTELQVIMNHCAVNPEEASERFYALYKTYSSSGTAVTAKVTGIPVEQAAREMDDITQKWKFIHSDKRLIEMFHTLTDFDHYILGNGTKQGIEKTLSVLGVPVSTFKEIITSETVGENKPGTKGFEYILNKTQLPPDQHLMVGDRVEVDLVPAKNLGMKTCLVWATNPSPMADIVIPMIYDVAKVVAV